MIAPGSLNFRLLAGAFVWILAALAVGGFVLSEIFRAHSEAQVAQRLEIELNLLAARLQVASDGTASLERCYDARLGHRDGLLFHGLMDRGSILFIHLVQDQSPTESQRKVVDWQRPSRCPSFDRI